MAQKENHFCARDELVDQDKMLRIKAVVNDHKLCFETNSLGERIVTVEKLTFDQMERLRAMDVQMHADELGSTVLYFKSHKTVIKSSAVLYALFVFGFVATLAQAAHLGYTFYTYHL